LGKRVELPLVEPLYKTYHNQGMATAILKENPSIRNWYLNQIMNLMCNTKFLDGFTSPEIKIKDSYWGANPHLDKFKYSFRYLKGCCGCVIREMLDSGAYVVFTGVDDFYIPGKSWYRQRHFVHDGMICGYDQTEKTYCIYAYDQNWIYRKFWVPQKSLDAGRKAAVKQEGFGYICAIKPKADIVEFSPELVHDNLWQYLNTHIGKKANLDEDWVFGIDVQKYIGQYVGKLMDGSIPYEKLDWRVFRLIWEHKKVMLERIIKTEEILRWDPAFSERYRPLASSADLMRMLYASHHMKRRDSVLPIIQKKLLVLHEEEKQVLTDFVEKLGKEVTA